MSASAIGYAILLMNTGKDGPGPSPAAKRQEAFTEVVKRRKPSIIFTQECTGPFVKGLGTEYVKLGITEAGFFFNVNEFTCIDYTQDTDLAKLVKTLQLKQKISNDFQFLGRDCVVKLTSNGVPNLEILALSWHGQHSKVNDTTKIRLLKELFVVVKEMRKLEKLRDKRGKMLPVIIGGDFNIEVTKWPSDPDLVYHIYTPSERRKGRLIDIFVTTKDLKIKDLDFVTMSFKLKDGTLAADVLKHDPVQGLLINTPCIDKSQSSNKVATKRDTTIKKRKAAIGVDAPAEEVKLAKIKRASEAMRKHKHNSSSKRLKVEGEASNSMTEMSKESTSGERYDMSSPVQSDEVEHPIQHAWPSEAAGYSSLGTPVRDEPPFDYDEGATTTASGIPIVVNVGPRKPIQEPNEINFDLFEKKNLEVNGITNKTIRADLYSTLRDQPIDFTLIKVIDYDKPTNIPKQMIGFDEFKDPRLGSPRTTKTLQIKGTSETMRKHKHNSSSKRLKVEGEASNSMTEMSKRWTLGERSDMSSPVQTDEVEHAIQHAWPSEAAGYISPGTPVRDEPPFDYDEGATTTASGIPIWRNNFIESLIMY